MSRLALITSPAPRPSEPDCLRRSWRPARQDEPVAFGASASACLVARLRATGGQSRSSSCLRHEKAGKKEIKSRGPLTNPSRDRARNCNFDRSQRLFFERGPPVSELRLKPFAPRAYLRLRVLSACHDAAHSDLTPRYTTFRRVSGASLWPQWLRGREARADP